MEFDMTKVRVGKIVTGTVIVVNDDNAYVDIKAFADGVIYKEGLSLDKSLDSCKEVLEEGQELEFKITNIDHENQRILLSRTDLMRDKNRLAFDEETKDFAKFEAKVTRVNKGGLVLQYKGVNLFMPASQIDIKRVNQEDFKDQTLECVVIENSDRRVVVSRRKVLQQEQKEAKKEAFEAIKVGDVLDGTVTNIVKYGAFIDLGDIEGLLHISEFSHHRVEKPGDVLKKGDEVKVKIIGKKDGKLSLSIKALLPTPWDEFAATHEIGAELEGTIVRKMKNGMLVEVAEDVVGMISSRDYSWNPHENLAGQVEVGDKLNLKLLSIDAKKRRMSLSKKHLEYNPWADVSVKKGEEVSGVVSELQTNGALVQVQNVNAFLPISEISNERINQVSDVLKIDQVINAIVLDVNKQQWRMKLSIKALKNKKEREMFEKYKETEEEAQTQTLGELFADKFEELKDDE